MKTLILCEGLHDNIFWNQILKDVDPSKCKSFVMPNESMGSKLSEETRLLRKIQEKYCPYEFLIKAEGGKQSLIDIFRENLTLFLHFQSKDIDVVLNFDLDGGGERNFEKTIKSMIRGIQPDISYETEDVFEDETIAIKKVKFSIKQINLTVKAVLFKESLEDAANIRERDDREEEIQKKIISMIEKEALMNTLISNGVISSAL